MHYGGLVCVLLCVCALIPGGLVCVLIEGLSVCSSHTELIEGLCVLIEGLSVCSSHCAALVCLLFASLEEP